MILLKPTIFADASYFSTHERGWHWYQRDERDAQPVYNNTNQTSTDPQLPEHIPQDLSQKPTATEALKQFQKQLGLKSN